ncbi:MAG: DNA translocase FtsK 4TM domain-containing protein [Lachnospiraceae bacterium]
MAGNNKSTSGNAGKGKSNKTDKNVPENSFASEIIVWIIAAVMLILELGNFGLCGVINYISRFSFGLFGVVQYILPIVIMFSAFFLHVNEYKKRAVSKVVLVGILLLCIGVIAQIMDGNVLSYEVKKIYMAGYHDKVGGGVLFGFFAFLFHKMVGAVGTYIIMALAIVVCIVFFAEVSIIELIKSLFTFNGEEDDDEYPKNDLRDEKREKKSKREKGYKEIVEETYSRERKQEKKRASMLDRLTVLPVEENQNTKGNENSQSVKQEDVHEITMNYEVPLPGEAMENIVKEDKKEKKPVRKKQEAPKKTSPAIQNKTADVTKTMSAKEVGKSDDGYKFPPMDLLKASKGQAVNADAEMRENAKQLKEVLESFGVGVTMQNYSCGPSVTRYEMIPDQGVKVSKITGLADDLMMNLAAQSIRIEAPIPGKRAVGIEIPNATRSGVGFRELIDTEKFIKHPSKIAFAVGKDIEGNVIVEDIAKMPHLLIAGATGSGKSVCTNTLIMSILYKARPDEVKLILVDPKQVELKVYNGIPHLLTPVVTDPKKAAGALNWAVGEMTKRYQLFSECNVRNIQGYNAKVKELEKSEQLSEVHLKPMPQIVIIVDELADLMMVAKAEVEEAIVRLAQLARAAGIHLVIATQRPSVDVVTGLIKANVPSRIALSVSSGVDSRTIIDSVGAEKLLGNGDMLFYPTNYPKPLRVQGAYISDDEVVRVVDFLKENNVIEEQEEDISSQFVTNDSSAGVVNSGNGTVEDGNDEYFVQAGKFIIEKDKASIGMLQRMFKIGFNRAARIMDQLHSAGVVGPEEGTKPRQILMTLEEFEQYVKDSGNDSQVF